MASFTTQDGLPGKNQTAVRYAAQGEWETWRGTTSTSSQPLLSVPTQTDDVDDDVGKDWVIVGDEEIQKDRSWFEQNLKPGNGQNNGAKTLKGHYHLDVGWGRWKTRLYEVDWTISGEHPHNCGCNRQGQIQAEEEEEEEDDEDDEEDGGDEEDGDHDAGRDGQEEHKQAGDTERMTPSHQINQATNLQARPAPVGPH